MDQNKLSHALETAQSAAYEAGSYLLEKQRNIQVLSKKAVHDDLLDADLAAEAILIRKLREHFPSASILSEEAGEIRNQPEYQWIIDPLDGSMNFQHGSPFFGISLSLRLNNVTSLGVIYLPKADEMFTCMQSQGVFLQGSQVATSTIRLVGQAIIHVGDFATNGDVQENQRRLRYMARLGTTVGRIRMIGTAATDLAYVSCGRADALVTFSTPPWDYEVGKLLVTEAGGKVSVLQDRQGKPLVIYSNAAIHEQLVDVLLK